MRTLLALALLLALAVEATPLGMATHAPEVDVPTPMGRYYVDNDLCVLGGCIVSVWVYQETNGIWGLQRRDPIVDDTMGGAISPDTLVLAVHVAEP